MKIDRNESGGLDETPEAKSVAADSAIADAEVAKLAADLQDLRQTLLRRQADFDNYRKRIERERAEDSKRNTARMIEALIPIIDGFEHALAAHREPAYETYRKAFELIYKQLLATQLGEGVEELLVDQLEALAVIFVGWLAVRGEGMLETVNDRNERFDHPGGIALGILGALPFDALAVIVEVGLAPQQRLPQVLQIGG